MNACPRLASALLAVLACRAHAGDFDGDGFDDLAIGVPRAEIAGEEGGSVQVLYGSGPAGITVAFRQTLTLLDAGPNQAEAYFGYALATGDFDGDGFDDLAVGAPELAFGGPERSGAVYEYAGSPDGLTLRAVWHQDVPGLADQREENEVFGAALAAADFDGDGRDDLAINVREAIDGALGAGAVHVLRGTGSGLGAGGDKLWHQGKPSVKDQPEPGDWFGWQLGAGDLDGDGRADLAIGIYGESRTHGDLVTEGAVAILYGAKNGLSAARDRLFDAFDLGGGLGGNFQILGHGFAIGNFDGKGPNELAIGAPTAAVLGWQQAGAVYVLSHKNGKPKLTGALILTADLEGVPGSAGTNELFGYALAAADFDGDAFADLAVGERFDTVSGLAADKTGSVKVFHGSAAGLTSAGCAEFYEGGGGLMGTADTDEDFGAALAAGDFDGDGAADLAVGAPSETIGAAEESGALYVLYGGVGAGLAGAGSQLFFETILPGFESSLAGERFGWCIAK